MIVSGDLTFGVAVVLGLKRALAGYKGCNVSVEGGRAKAVTEGKTEARSARAVANNSVLDEWIVRVLVRPVPGPKSAGTENRVCSEHSGTLFQG